MKNCKLLLSLLFFLLLSQFATASSDSATIERTNFRLDKLEEYRMIQDEKAKVFEEKVDNRLSNFQDNYNWLEWLFGGSFGLTAIIGLILWFRTLPKKIERLAEEKANEKLSKYFEEKKSKIEAIVKGVDEDEKLKKDKTILIVSKKDEDTSFLNLFSKQFNFKTEFIEMDDYEKVTYNYDVLLINNESGQFTEMMDTFVDDLKSNALLFCFGKAVRLDENKQKHFSSATFRSQLYGNLMSALRYQKLID